MHTSSTLGSVKFVCICAVDPAAACGCTLLASCNALFQLHGLHALWSVRNVVCSSGCFRVPVALARKVLRRWGATLCGAIGVGPWEKMILHLLPVTGV